jgi:YfiH family protein
MSPPFVTSRLLDVPHGFFGREGGVSEGVYASLNCGPGSADAPAAVAENRARAATAIGFAPSQLVSLAQVHSAIAVRCEAPWGAASPAADGIVTTTPGLAVSALAADCAPVLLASAGVVAAAHAGWKGALGGVLEATVAEMRTAGAGRIVAAIGPCIAQASYEVGPEFHARFVDADAGNDRFFKSGRTDRLHFDLAGYCAARLAAAGVAAVDLLGIDTCADGARYHSNRRHMLCGAKDYGRNISVIALRQN